MSTKSIHKQLHLLKRSCIGIEHNLTSTIVFHSHEVNNMGALCSIVNKKPQTPPQAEQYKRVTMEEYGTKLTRPGSLTIPERIQAAYDVHTAQMSTPPGTQLLFADKTYNDAGCNSVSLHPERNFTAAHLEAYSPGITTNISICLQQKVIEAHKNVAHIFQHTVPSPNLTWPFKYIPKQAPRPQYIKDLVKSIQSHQTKSRHLQYTINIFGRLSPQWFKALVDLI